MYKVYFPKIVTVTFQVLHTLQTLTAPHQEIESIFSSPSLGGLDWLFQRKELDKSDANHTKGSAPSGSLTLSRETTLEPGRHAVRKRTSHKQVMRRWFRTLPQLRTARAKVSVDNQFQSPAKHVSGQIFKWFQSLDVESSCLCLRPCGTGWSNHFCCILSEFLTHWIYEHKKWVF